MWHTVLLQGGVCVEGAWSRDDDTDNHHITAATATASATATDHSLQPTATDHRPQAKTQTHTWQPLIHRDGLVRAVVYDKSLVNQGSQEVCLRRGQLNPAHSRTTLKVNREDRQESDTERATTAHQAPNPDQTQRHKPDAAKPSRPPSRQGLRHSCSKLWRSATVGRVQYTSEPSKAVPGGGQPTTGCTGSQGLVTVGGSCMRTSTTIR